MSQSNSDEIDLGVVFNKIKEGFNNFLINLFYGFRYILKNWWIILLLLILGGVSGYFIENNNKQNKTTTIIVQNNFNSTSYVYDAVDHLNNMLGDTLYLKNNGLKPKVISSIEIEPIVNMLELLEKTMYNYRGLEPLLEKADFEDELLTSEVFNTDYRFHRITLETNFEGNEQVINNLMLFLNKNKKFNEIKEVVIKDTNYKLDELDKTIVYINNILKNYSIKDTNNQDPNKIFISTGSTVTDLGILVEKKNSSLKQQEELKTEIVKYNKIVTVLNNPTLYKKPTLISINTKSLAFIFVFAYLFFAYSRYKYLKVKDMAESKTARN